MAGKGTGTPSVGNQSVHGIAVRPLPVREQ